MVLTAWYLLGDKGGGISTRSETNIGWIRCGSHAIDENVVSRKVSGDSNENVAVAYHFELDCTIPHLLHCISRSFIQSFFNTTWRATWRDAPFWYLGVFMQHIKKHAVGGWTFPGVVMIRFQFAVSDCRFRDFVIVKVWFCLRHLTDCQGCSPTCDIWSPRPMDIVPPAIIWLPRICLCNFLISKMLWVLHAKQ